MKISISLFVASVFILGSFQANAKRVFPLLLNDANLLGRKVKSIGPNDKVATQTKIAATNGAATAAYSELNENDDGEDSGTSSHRYFPDDKHQPSTANNNVNTPHRNL